MTLGDDGCNKIELNHYKFKGIKRYGEIVSIIFCWQQLFEVFLYDLTLSFVVRHAEVESPALAVSFPA